MENNLHYWDAADLGCGELVIQLKIKISNLKQGELLEVRATDPGAVEDLPAWAKMTGNNLIKIEPPSYLFKSK